MSTAPPSAPPVEIAFPDELKNEKVRGWVREMVGLCKPDRVYFCDGTQEEFDRAVIRDVSFPILNTVAQVMRDFPDIRIEVQGHTDNKGKKTTNKKLSEARAESVIAFLETQGVARGRMTGRGLADEVPVAENTTETGRQQNRRVQVQIAANEKLQKDAAAEGQAQPASHQSP
jgi:GTP-dependent phosphoenolpyruvate carboxykinase